MSNQTTVLEPHLVAPISLRNNFKWTFAGNLTYAGCQWGMLSILAKAGNPAVVGQFALGLAIAAPVFMFSNLQLRAIQATDARNEFEFGDYFTLRLLSSVVGLLAVVVIAASLRYDMETRLVIALVGISKAVESFSDVVAGLLQKVELLNQVAISLMIRGVFSFLVFGATFLVAHRLLISLSALVLVWAGVFAGYDLGRARSVLHRGQSFFHFQTVRLRRLLRLSAILGLVMALVSLNVNIPRYLLVKYLGQSELGIFAAMAYLLVAVTLLINALGQSASAHLSRLFASRDLIGFRRTLNKLIWMALAIPLVGVPISALFGRELLTFFYRAEYGNHATVLVVMVATAGLAAAGSFLGYALTAARLFRVQLPIMSATVLTTVVLCLVLIPRMGLMGAALALFTSEMVLVGTAVAGLRRALTARGA